MRCIDEWLRSNNGRSAEGTTLSANASWYTARTGVSGSTNQNGNAFGRWGSSTVSGPNQTVHTQSQSNARGSAGSFSSSTGAEGAGVCGARGNTSGGVKTSGGDVYAGADGNVFKKTSDGWENYDNGSSNSVREPSTAPKTSTATQPRPSTHGRASTTAAQPQGSTQGSRPGAPERTSSGAAQAGGAGRFAQLEQDRQARLGGARPQRQFSEGRAGRSDAARDGRGGRPALRAATIRVSQR